MFDGYSKEELIIQLEIILNIRKILGEYYSEYYQKYFEQMELLNNIENIIISKLKYIS